MLRIDFHHHLWPDELIAELARRDVPPFLRGGRLTTSEGAFAVDLDAHRLDRRLTELSERGIDAAVCSLQPTLGIDALPQDEAARLRRAYHRGIVELAASSGGRIVPLADGAALDGFAGASIAGRELHDPARIAPLLAGLAERRQLLFVHPGPAVPAPGRPSWWGGILDYTAELQAAYVAWIELHALHWPELPVVFAILAGGAPFQLERLRSRGVDPRAIFAGRTYLETASYGRLALELCLAAYGVDRLVYGSDSPVIDPAPTFGAVHNLGKAAFDALSSHNPLGLLAGYDRLVDRAETAARP
jgi:predicted TIM-barrel fold metal-dependent hydrolase